MTLPSGLLVRSSVRQSADQIWTASRPAHHEPVLVALAHRQVVALSDLLQVRIVVASAVVVAVHLVAIGDADLDARQVGLVADPRSRAVVRTGAREAVLADTRRPAECEAALIVGRAAAAIAVVQAAQPRGQGVRQLLIVLGVDLERVPAWIRRDDRGLGGAGLCRAAGVWRALGFEGVREDHLVCVAELERRAVPAQRLGPLQGPEDRPPQLHLDVGPVLVIGAEHAREAVLRQAPGVLEVVVGLSDEVVGVVAVGAVPSEDVAAVRPAVEARELLGGPVEAAVAAAGPARAIRRIGDLAAAAGAVRPAQVAVEDAAVGQVGVAVVEAAEAGATEPGRPVAAPLALTEVRPVEAELVRRAVVVFEALGRVQAEGRVAAEPAAADGLDAALLVRRALVIHQVRAVQVDLAAGGAELGAALLAEGLACQLETRALAVGVSVTRVAGLGDRPRPLPAAVVAPFALALPAVAVTPLALAPLPPRIGGFALALGGHAERGPALAPATLEVGLRAVLVREGLVGPLDAEAPVLADPFGAEAGGHLALALALGGGRLAGPVRERAVVARLDIALLVDGARGGRGWFVGRTTDGQDARQQG